MRLAPGERLGPYEVLEPLGAGGMGEIYRARDPRLGRDLAVKVLPERLARDPDALARFQLEARAVAALTHPNIRGLHDIGQQGDIHFAALELLEGTSLRTTLLHGPLSESRAVGIAAQVASGLSAAHGKGIVHRDLKPENVFLCDDSLVKILDFGLARHKVTVEGGAPGAALTEPGLVVGTPAYMSPEQIRGEDVDARSDLFALGILLWEMVAGRPPFDAPSPTETMHAILKGEPEGGERFSPGLRQLLDHALEKSPEARFQSARDLAVSLRALGHATTWQTVAAPAVRKSGRRSRPAWKLVAAGLAALAAIAAAVIVARREGGLAFLARPDEPPRFTRVTFRRGNVVSARFTADGQSVVHSAAWEDEPANVFITRLGSPESRTLGLPNAIVRSAGKTSEIAVITRREDVYTPGGSGVLARVPLEGGAPRVLAEDVEDACWSPDGASLAITRRAGGGHVLEYPEGKVLYRSTSRLYQVRVSPDGHAVAFLERTADAARLLVVGDDGSPRLSAPLGTDTVRLSWSPSGREVWYSCRRGPPPWGLFALSLSGRRRTLLPGPGLVLHDVAADGRALVETFALRDGILLSTPSGRELDVSWLEDSAVGALSSDGTLLVFGEVGDGGGPNGTTYLRKAEGGSPVRLAEGFPCSLSFDRRSVLVDAEPGLHRLVVVSTGAGPAHPLATGPVKPAGCGYFTPDGLDVVFTGRREGKATRAHRLRLATGDVDAFGPEGGSVPGGVFSPDGSQVVVRDVDGQPLAIDPSSGRTRRLTGLTEGETIVQWTAGGELLVRAPSGMPARLWLVNPETAERRPWRVLAPEDRAGIIAIEEIAATRDLGTYAYSFSRVLSSALHVVEGLPER